jgi:deazaflavin-dependent oxidoreductase (nitroreductase family)
VDVLAALAASRTIDITTTGRRSGELHRMETWAWPLDGTVYLTGSPGPRDWYANLKARPELTVHLKHGVHADLSALARPIEDAAERRAVLTRLLAGGPYDLEEWVAGSPLVELDIS